MDTEKKEKKASLAEAIVTQSQERCLGVAGRIFSARQKECGTKSPGSEARTYAFIAACLQIFYKKDFSEEELSRVITDGNGDCGIDAVYKNPDGHWDIFDFKSDGSCNPAELTHFFDTVSRAVLEEPEDYAPYNRYLQAALQNIHAEEGGRNAPVRVFVVRGRNGEANAYFEKKKKELESYVGTQVHFVDAEGLVERRFGKESYVPEWELKLDGAEERLFFDKDKSDELIVRISVAQLIGLLERCQKEGNDLFNKNVRAFLGDAQLSEGISESLRKSPELFHKFHNGIKIAAEKIEARSPRRFVVRCPQVINGAQTINTIAAAKNISSDALKMAQVICKIYKAGRDLTDSLCQTSNTQAKVDLSDLRSNDDLQFRLELLIGSFPQGAFEYRRKKSRGKRGANTILLTEFTQWACAALLGRPADAKNKKRALFDATKSGLYNSIYGRREIEDPKAVERLCRTGVSVRAFVAEEAKKSPDKGKFLKSADLHIVAGVYLLAGTDVYDDCRKVRDIAECYFSKKADLGANKVFTKSSDTWAYIREEVMMLKEKRNSKGR